MNNSLDSVTIFVVNLKKDIEKKEHMLKLCKTFSLNCHFIDAVYGKSLSEEEINRHYLKQKANKYQHKSGLAPGEIGCLLSHKSIYQMIISEDIKHALILEDDIEFDNKVKEIINKLDLFPEDWEVVLLGHHSHTGRNIDTKANIWWKQYVSENYFLARPSEIGYGTYGYLINKRGAQRLLNKLDQYYKPIDHYTGNDRELNVYTINPAVIKIHTDMSDYHHSMDDRKESVTKIIEENKTKILSLNQILRLLGLFNFLVSLRDSFKTILPLRKYE